MVPFSLDHAEVAGALPPLHNDPLDRMLIAQARVEGFMLLTRDRPLRRYGEGVLQV